MNSRSKYRHSNQNLSQKWICNKKLDAFCYLFHYLEVKNIYTLYPCMAPQKTQKMILKSQNWSKMDPNGSKMDPITKPMTPSDPAGKITMKMSYFQSSKYHISQNNMEKSNFSLFFKEVPHFGTLQRANGHFPRYELWSNFQPKWSSLTYISPRNIE